jgi:DNA-binding CsgD family transcriptional regulator
MANANPDSTGAETLPTLPPTVLVLLQCTMTQAVLDHLFAMGAARVLPADAPAPPWLAAAANAPVHQAADAGLSLAARLSPGDLKVVELIGLGHATRAIAKILHKSAKTIESQKSRIKKRLGLDSTTRFAQWCARFVDARAG